MSPGFDWARPAIVISTLDKTGKPTQAAWCLPLDQKMPEWQQLVHIRTIPADAEGASVRIDMHVIAADVYFDDFSAELDPDPKSAPPVQPANSVLPK